MPKFQDEFSKICNRHGEAVCPMCKKVLEVRGENLVCETSDCIIGKIQLVNSQYYNYKNA